MEVMSMAKSFSERFGSTAGNDETFPACWGDEYDRFDEGCRECPKSMSCRMEFGDNHTIQKERIQKRPRRYRMRSGVHKEEEGSRPRSETRRSYYADAHSGAGSMPREGEGHGERLGKNIMASLIRAIAFEVLEFFSKWQF